MTMNTSELPDSIACPDRDEAAANFQPSLLWCVDGAPLPPCPPSVSRLRTLLAAKPSDGAKVAMKLFGRPDVNLLSFARNHFQAMEDNAHYLEPMPSQETFATVLDAFDECYMEVQALRTALRVALARKDTCRTKLEQALDQRGSYVQALSNGNKATMITAALGVQRERHKVGPLEPPLGLRVIPGPSTGEVIITWGKVKYSKSYMLKYGPEGAAPEHLVLLGRRKRSLMLPVMDVPYIFSIAASGSAGLSSYSPLVKLMVR